jgi:hypothetical protein
VKEEQVLVIVITGENPPGQTVLSGNTLTLKPFSVAVVEMN